MINDSGLVITALKNFSGSMTNYVEETIGQDGIVKLMANIEDRGAFFQEVISYCESESETVLFISITKGSVFPEKKVIMVGNQIKYL